MTATRASWKLSEWRAANSSIISSTVRSPSQRFHISDPIRSRRTRRSTPRGTTHEMGGTIHRGRRELEQGEPEKWKLALVTNAEQLAGTTAEALRGADVLISLTVPGPGVIKPDWISGMAGGAVVFACANPVPEIWPWEARDAGARVVATGRSDFPNQINNSLGFPGIFRGTLDVRARTITDEMCLEAALELARCAEERGLRDDYIIPTMDDWEVFPREAAAVGMKAVEQGVALVTDVTAESLRQQAQQVISRSRQMVDTLQKEGLVKLPEP